MEALAMSSPLLRLLPHGFSTPSFRSSATRPKATNARAELNRDGKEVHVIGIGSRKDAIFDFCLASSPPSHLRFWTIHSRDSSKVQLLEKLSDMEKKLDWPLHLHSCCAGIILVASAGHGSDDVIALELLNAVKSTGGLSVTILLKPFCFEGQRRQEEVANFVRKLQSSSQLYVVVETDALLRTREETFEEAIKTVNMAVLFSIKMISFLICDGHKKQLDALGEAAKEIEFSEILKLLDNFGESKVGYGAARDVESSMMQALQDSPFLTSELKEANGIIVLAISCAKVMSSNDLCKAISTFRRITKCSKRIVGFGIHENVLDQEVVVSTLLVLGGNVQKASPKKGLLSSFTQVIPFLLSFLQRDSEATHKPFVDSERSLNDRDALPGDVRISELNVMNGFCNYLGMHSEVGDKSKDKIFGTNDTKKTGFSVAEDESFVESVCQTTREENDPLEEQLDSWVFGPAFDFAKKWANERAGLSRTTIKLQGNDVFAYLGGIKLSEKCDGGYELLELPDPEKMGDERSNFSDISDERSNFSNLLDFPDRGVTSIPSTESLIDMYNPTSFSRGKDGLSRKPGTLSVRAASMLEAEKDSEKKWSPILEIEYRGGLYRGRCQGGLPEGKGCLTLNDGSYYDGMWQYGKRSGSGTFCYSNGDMYQGTWRDDFMHGKGWLYFHTGDRWFGNFWKGKANGESRFYSKSGSVFFGHFQNGWRHGEGLYIDADGSRWSEFWENGVLMRRIELD